LINKSSPNIVAIIVTRNDNDYLPSTLKALFPQVNHVIIIDDGSSTPVKKLRETTNKECEVVRLRPHTISYVGRPELATRWNIGFKYAEKLDPDFILMMGSDHILESGYVKTLLNKINGSNVAIAGGRYIGEWYKPKNPGGSGRLIDAKWWKKFNGMRFPINWGWESWVVYAAESQGKNVFCYYDVPTKLGRKIQMNSFKAYTWGKAAYCLGYLKIIGLLRCLLYFFRQPSWGISMAAGFLFHTDCKRYESWLLNIQQVRQMNLFKHYIKLFLKYKRFSYVYNGFKT